MEINKVGRITIVALLLVLILAGSKTFFDHWILISIFLTVALTLLILLKISKARQLRNKEIDVKIRQLRKYVEVAMYKGYSVEEIRKNLIKKKWSREHIDKLFESVHKEHDLSHFFEKNITAGHSIESIKEKLKNAGLHDDFINRTIDNIEKTHHIKIETLDENLVTELEAEIEEKIEETLEEELEETLSEDEVNPKKIIE